MTLETSVEHLLPGDFRESNDHASVGCRNMLPSRPVTTLAAGAFRRFLLRDDALVVRILVKGIGDIGMAVLAHLAADVFIVTGSRRVHPCRRLCTSDGCRKKEDKKTNPTIHKLPSAPVFRLPKRWISEVDLVWLETTVNWRSRDQDALAFQ